MAVQIRQHRPGKDLDDFVSFHHELYRDDPAWVPPLNMEIRERLSPGRNPFFEHAEATLFTAWEGARMVGRISAQIDHEHLRIHQDETGFFGFFDTVDDPRVAQALVDAAAEWLALRGMRRMRGPFNLSINEEMGLLVDGFEHPPFLMTPHALPHQGPLAEATGLEKVMDLYHWRYVSGEIPKRALRAHEQIRSLPEVRFRRVDKSRMRSEVDTLLEIFNDAWSDNWGFVPATPAETRKMASDLKMILDPDLAFFVEIHGRPMGLCVALPNLNEATHDLRGALAPFGLFKLLWRLKVKRPSSARLMLLGIRRELRGVKRYGALSTAMYAELAQKGAAKGYTWGELSWTLETNRPVNLGIRAMGGEVYKTYRMYEKPIGADADAGGADRADRQAQGAEEAG